MSKNFIDPKTGHILPPHDSGSDWKPREIEGSLYLTLWNAAKSHMEESGDWEWLHYAITGDTLTANEAFKLGRRFAMVLSQQGFGKGDIVHMIVGNFNHSYALCFGVWILGGAISLGDINLEPRSVRKQLVDLRPKFTFCIPETAELTANAIQELEDVKVFCFGNSEHFDNFYEILVNCASVESHIEPHIPSDPKTEMALIFWTSGTTGHPKGICHSHHSTLNIMGKLKSMVTSNTNIVATTCFFHASGFMTGIHAILKKQTYFHMFGPGFKLDHLLSIIIQQKPKQITVGTHHYVQLAESDFLEKTNPKHLESIELIIPFGAAVPQSCEELVKQKFKNLKGIANMYGATEMGGVSSGISTKSLGTIYTNVRKKIVDLKTGQVCRPGEHGEICVKSEHSRMIGYFGREKETKEYFDEEGFCRTGDLGYYTEEGEIYYVDRIKELIKYMGNHVSPTELEDIMQRHPAVLESLFFGKPDPNVQEIICAVVVLKPNSKVTESALMEFVNDQVASYKQIRGEIIFRDKIPRNSVGKLLRRDMREWAKHQLRES